MTRDAPVRSARGALAVLLGALVLGAVFLAVVLLLASCSSKIFATIAAEGDATLGISAEIPPPLANYLRGAILRIPAGSPLLDPAAIRGAIASERGLALSAPLMVPSPSAPSNPDSMRADLRIERLGDPAAAGGSPIGGLAAISVGKGWKELRFRLDRENSKYLPLLFPGLDPRLIRDLSPPALDPEPVDAEMYKTNLRNIFPKAAYAALESATVDIVLGVPGPVLDSGGGAMIGGKLNIRIPFLDFLILERPIEFWIRWRG
jgi:hypothetical protein